MVRASRRALLSGFAQELRRSQFMSKGVRLAISPSLSISRLLMRLKGGISRFV
jgi:hypothetical protein